MQCLSTKNLGFMTVSSGSKGNSSLVLCGKTKLIIDDGITYSRLKKSIESIGLSFKDFSGILITHAHSDHVKGLEMLLKHTQLKVLIPEEMYDELKEIVPKSRVVFIKKHNKLNDTEITLIRTSHDTACSVGYIITYEDKSLVYITDTGYINRKYFDILSNKKIYLIESNHDEEMLRNGPYPPFLKARVLSDHGHLSNKMTASYLEKFVGKETKYVFLAHLSEHNNTAKLALEETQNKLKGKNIEIIIASQYEESKLVEV